MRVGFINFGPTARSQEEEDVIKRRPFIIPCHELYLRQLPNVLPLIRIDIRHLSIFNLGNKSGMYVESCPLII